MGIDCSPLIVDLFLFYLWREFNIFYLSISIVLISNACSCVTGFQNMSIENFHCVLILSKLSSIFNHANDKIEMKSRKWMRGRTICITVKHVCVFLRC